MSVCGENELDIKSDVTPIKVNLAIVRDVDVNCDVFGATQYSGTRSPKKVKIKPTN